MKERTPGLARNMSAPPRSIVSFRPYGTTRSTSPAQARNGAGGGLRWLLRARPDTVLALCLPDLHARMGGLREGALEQARGGNREAAAGIVTEIRSLRLAGLVTVAAGLAGRRGLPAPDALAKEPAESLLDRLEELARHLSPVSTLPAMAVAERSSGHKPGRTKAGDAHAALWVLTHLNGRTFDRDGLPLLAPDMAEGGTWDLFTP